jgi:hypothetical protein
MLRAYVVVFLKRSQLFDLDEKSYMGLMQFSRQVALCLQEEVV